MEKTFVNFTNHPSAQWSDRQRREALKYGNIQDIPFPDVDPLGDHDYIDGLADSCIVPAQCCVRENFAWRIRSLSGCKHAGF